MYIQRTYACTHTNKRGGRCGWGGEKGRGKENRKEEEEVWQEEQNEGMRTERKKKEIRKERK